MPSKSGVTLFRIPTFAKTFNHHITFKLVLNKFLFVIVSVIVSVRYWSEDKTKLGKKRLAIVRKDNFNLQYILLISNHNRVEINRSLMTTTIQIFKNTNLRTKLDYNASLNQPWSEVRLTNLNVREQHRERDW